MTTDSTAVLGQDYQPTTPMGRRVYVPPLSGDISGPWIQGRVIPHSDGGLAPTSCR